MLYNKLALFGKLSKRSFQRHIGCSILNLFLHLPTSKVNVKIIYIEGAFGPLFFPLLLQQKSFHCVSTRLGATVIGARIRAEPSVFVILAFISEIGQQY